MSAKKFMLIGFVVFFALSTLGTSVLLGMNYHYLWYNLNYKTEQMANQHFSRAFNANNIDIFANASETALTYYDNFHGNPDWWFPLDYTDWDIIKQDAIDIINTARIAANNSIIGSDAYEEALMSSQSSMSTIKERLGTNIIREWCHPSKFWGSHSWWLWAIMSLILLAVCSTLLNDFDYKY